MNQATTKRGLMEKYSTTRLLVGSDTEVVYEGRDAKRQRQVVIRISEVPSDTFQTLKDLAALEAAAHPSLPRLIDFGIEDECLYIVVEAVKGNDLLTFDSYLMCLASPQRRLRALAQVFLQIAWALNALHENGLTPGEIRPEKIVVNDAGRGRLLVSDVLKKPTGDRELSPVSTDLREFGRLMYKMLCGIDYHPENALPTELQSSLTPAFDTVLLKAASGDPME